MLSSFKSPVIQGFVLTVFLHVCMNLVSGISIEVIPRNPKLKQTVTLNIMGITGGRIRFATWYKGKSTSATDQILNYFPSGSEIKGEKYFPEAQGKQNGSLVITNAVKDFDGYYTVQVQTDILQQNSVLLTVNGIASAGLSPFALFGMLLFSALSFL